MISRKISAAIAGVAVIGVLGGGALALANDEDPASPARTSSSPSLNDDGTADQGPGDAPGTRVSGDDDGTADQGPGDAPSTEDGDDSGHDGSEDHSGHGGGEDNSGPGGNSGQG